MTTQLALATAPEAMGARATEVISRTTFEFREVTEVGEIEALLALRHRVYGTCEATRGFIDPEGPSLLLDPYDRFARLFGLFARVPGEATLVGTMRVVSLDLGPARMALEMVASQHPRTRARLHGPRRKPLPFLEMCRDHGPCEARVMRSIARGEAVVEAGRFALAPEFRSGRVALGLAREMIVSSLAQLFLPRGYDRGFINCVPEHAHMYQQAGFRLLGGDERAVLPRTGVEFVSLEVTRDQVVGEIRPRVLERAAEMAATGRIVIGAGGGRGARPAAALQTPRPSFASIANRPLCVSGIP